MQTISYIGLGSNLGDRRGYIDEALAILAAAEGIKLLRTSDVLETSALGDGGGPEFLNAIAEIETTLTAETLHKRIVEIEDSLGRVREKKWSPRTIDLDLLLFGCEVIDSPRLVVPHPQMHLRSFVLKGLNQLKAELVHPVIGVRIGELTARLNGGDFVLNPQRLQLISVAGVIGVGKTTLTKNLAARLSCASLFEPYQANPFMPDVYAGKKELALDSELYWLISRAEQLAPDVLEEGRITISDYVFDKTRIYANRWLSTEQLDLYEKISSLFCSMVAEPALVIYLKDSSEKSLERIYRRNRPYEQKIGLPFLEELEAGYENLFLNWKICPVIRLQKSEFDYMNDANIDNLVNQIKRYVAL